MKRSPTKRNVGFTIKANMKNAVVEGPPPAGAFRERPIEPTNFRKVYQSAGLPIALNHSSVGPSITWKVEFDKLDYHHFLPLFFEGLRETTHPYEVFAREGVHDLLQNGGSKILPVVPQLILPIRSALNTRNRKVMCTTMKVLQHLVMSADMVGQALVPYYRQILPVFSIFYNQHTSSQVVSIHGQHGKVNIGELIQETLQIFERYGGEDAFRHIKSMVPTYQSCLL